jgi:uncharacterized protein (TIGR04222 family)
MGAKVNPYDLTAGPFLSLYFMLLCLGIAFGFYEHFREREPSPPADADRLTPVELAFLARGAERASDTAAIGLLQANAAEYDFKRRELRATVLLPDIPQFLLPFYRVLQRPKRVASLAGHFWPVLDTLRKDLVVRGLVYSAAESKKIAFQSAIPLFLLCGFGVVRVILGSNRGHPVGFITLLTLIAGVAGILFVLIQPRCRRAGRDAVRAYRNGNRRLMRAPMDDELLLALALTGVSTLRGTLYAPYGLARSAQNGGAGCGSSGGGGGCGGGGGGGGCGGCGGG